MLDVEPRTVVDGRVTFALPNLQGRVPVHEGNGITLGQSSGEVSHTLNISEMPAHTPSPSQMEMLLRPEA